MNLKQLSDKYNKLIDLLAESNRKKIESQDKVFDKEKHRLRIKAFLPVAVLYLAGLGISFSGAALIFHWWYSLILIMLLSSISLAENYNKLAYDFNFKDLDGSNLNL